MGGAVSGEVGAEDQGTPRAQPDEAGDNPQQRRLAGSVGTADVHDLTGGDVEVGAGERREPSQHADRRPDGDHRHGNPSARETGRSVYEPGRERYERPPCFA